MTEWTKTLLFVVAAGVSIGLAVLAESLSRPVASAEFERVGQEFYPEFDEPTAAQTLEVVSYDDSTSVIKTFDIKWGKDGWTISPYGYPADAKDQLNKTAASVVGITRTGLASRREADHEQYGVIDPLSDDATLLKGRGRRITLKDEKDGVLADYILGAPVKDREGYYYVRVPKEKETYIANVDLNLSTRFADWIESDLLKLNASDLKKVEVLDYSLDEQQGAILSRDRHVLTKDESSQWKLEELDEATEKIKTAAVNNLTRVLDELKIIGVRPKPKGLNPDLSLDQTVINNHLSAQLLRQSLQDKGFYLAQDREGNLQLVGKEGQLIAATNKGLVYDLYFGEQFSGSQFELEFGAAENTTAPKQLKEGEKKSEQGRYVFIAARFDPALLGEAPQAPESPAPPADDASEEDKKAAEAAAKKAQDDFKAAQTAHESKVADAKKQADELNERFKNWYYVISTENFEDLRPSRDKLVEPKTPETEAEADTEGSPFPSPGTEPSSTPSERTTPAEPAGESAPASGSEAGSEPQLATEAGTPAEAPRPAAASASDSEGESEPADEP